MSTLDLEQLERRLSVLFSNSSGNANLVALFRQLLLLLVDGEPVSPQQIASALGRPRAEVVALLSDLPSVELDGEGNLLGMGLTLNPTPHRFEVEGRSLFTWCALDALIFPGILNMAARVESPCPTTGIPIKARITAKGVEEITPASAVVSMVIPKNPEVTADVRSAFCIYGHFFSSSESASPWLAENPGAIIIPVAEAHRLGRMLAKHFLVEAP